MGLPPLQQAHFIQACCEQHLGQFKTGADPCAGRTATGLHTPVWGSSAHERSTRYNLPGQLALHSCLPVQFDVCLSLGQLQASGSKAGGGAVAGKLTQLAHGPLCRKCAGCRAGPDFSTLSKREGFAADLL